MRKLLLAILVVAAVVIVAAGTFLVSRIRAVSTDLAQRAARKLEYVDLATRLDDLKVPPGNRLEALAGGRQGQHSIRVNDQWRICFRFIAGDAHDVEFCDYH